MASLQVLSGTEVWVLEAKVTYNFGLEVQWMNPWIQIKVYIYFRNELSWECIILSHSSLCILRTQLIISTIWRNAHRSLSLQTILRERNSALEKGLKPLHLAPWIQMEHGSYKNGIKMQKNFAGKPKSAPVSARYLGIRKVEKTFFQRDLLEKSSILCFWHWRTLVKNWFYLSVNDSWYWILVVLSKKAQKLVRNYFNKCFFKLCTKGRNLVLKYNKIWVFSKRSRWKKVLKPFLTSIYITGTGASGQMSAKFFRPL